MQFGVSSASSVRVGAVSRAGSVRTRRVVSARALPNLGGGGGGAGGRGGGFGRGGGNGGNGGSGGDNFSKRFLAQAVLSGAAMMACASEAHAAAKADPKKNAKGGKAPPAPPPFDAAAFVSQFGGQAGLSGVIGFASAKAVVAAANFALISVAAVFAFLKWLEINNFVTVNWPTIWAFAQKQTKFLDQNGDGKLDAKDVIAAKAKFEGFMAQTVPSAAGFAAGFAAGLKF